MTSSGTAERALGEWRRLSRGSVELFLDSGAFSYFNRRGKAKVATAVTGQSLRHARLADHSYVFTPEYASYREGYASFVREHLSTLTAYSNLDVIRSAELTYANQLWLEDRGLRPLPVWHLGSDVVWLDRYLAEGYPYVCLGGMVGTPPATLRPALDRVWSERLVDERGFPRVRVHGFGMTSFELMRRYPWYSVDSNSWVDYGMRGRILFPPFRSGSRDYLRPRILYATARKLGKVPDEDHVRTCSPSVRRGLESYLRELGVPLGLSTFREVDADHELAEGEQWSVKPRTRGVPGQVETVVEEGIVNSQLQRLRVNLHHYLRVEALAPRWPWPLALRATRRGGLFS